MNIRKKLLSMTMKKVCTGLIVFALLVTLVPVQNAHAAPTYTFYIDFDYYGEPEPIDIYILTQVGTGAYTISKTLTIDPASVGARYKGGNLWELSDAFDMEVSDASNLPFCAVSRASVDGKWYVDKWAWNNLIYQPGEYMEYGAMIWFEYFSAYFVLTSSASTTNSITINRNWQSGAPAADVSYDIYRKFTLNNQIGLIKSVTLPQDQSSVTVTGLYAGDYIVKQSLPSYYQDDANYSFNRGTGKLISVNGNTSVTFTDTYTPPTYYNVTVGGLTGGTITPNKASATAGETVSLTVTPDTDKQLKAETLKYTDTSGDHFISGTSFTMPSSPVTISAEFEPRQYGVGIGSFGGGSVTADKATAASGDTVNLTVTPNAGKHLVEGSLCYKYGETTVSIKGTSFQMPASNVTVYADFDPKDRTVSTATVSNGTVMSDKTTAVAGDEINLTVTPSAGYHMVPGSLKYTNGTNTVPISGTSFIMPDANVTASCSFDKDIALTTASLPNGNLGAPYSSAVTASNGSVGYTCSATGLPSGLAIDPSTGVISGTPTDAGQFPVTVTATDADDASDTTSVTLPLTIYDATDCYLTGLSVDGATLTPAFDREKVVYNADTGGASGTSVSVTATTAVGDTLTIGGKAAVSGAATTVPLDNGTNLIPIVVTSPNGLSQKSYILSVNGTVSNADLAGLSLSAGALLFDPATTSYYVSVGSDVTSVDIAASPSDGKALMLLDGAILLSGVSRSVNLSVGENTVKLTVIAQDATTKTYTVTVNRGSSDATLSGLSLSAGTLSPAFSRTTHAYTATVPNGTTSLTVTPTASDGSATVKVNGSSASTPVPLSVGSNTVTVKVTGSDGVTTKTYTVTVTRETAIVVSTTSLPIGIVGAGYGKTLAATGGSGAYTWTWAAAFGSSLPSGITLSTDGVLSTASGSVLTDADAGSYTVEVTVTDTSDAAVTQTQTLTLTIRKGCCNGAYMIVSDGDGAYTGSYTDDGIPTLTVNTGISGFTYFGVNIAAVSGHAGKEVCVFVQIRNGQQIGIMSYKGDYDSGASPAAGFNVKPGDVIEVYIVDSLSNSGGSPVIL